MGSFESTNDRRAALVFRPQQMYASPVVQNVAQSVKKSDKKKKKSPLASISEHINERSKYTYERSEPSGWWT